MHFLGEPKDRFDRIAAEGKGVVAFLGNLRTSDFELVPLSEDIPKVDERRQLEFLGVAGLMGGKPETELAVPLDEETIQVLSTAYVRHFERQFVAAMKANYRGDSVAFCEYLWSLDSEN